jgi:hypothetical protein
MEGSQHSLLAVCFTLHSINATLAIVPQPAAGLWMRNMLVDFQRTTRRYIQKTSTLHITVFLVPGRIFL